MAYSASLERGIRQCQAAHARTVGIALQGWLVGARCRSGAADWGQIVSSWSGLLCCPAPTPLASCGAGENGMRNRFKRRVITRTCFAPPSALRGGSQCILTGILRMPVRTRCRVWGARSRRVARQETRGELFGYCDWRLVVAGFTRARAWHNRRIWGIRYFDWARGRAAQTPDADPRLRPLRVGRADTSGVRERCGARAPCHRAPTTPPVQPFYGFNPFPPPEI